MDKQLFEMEESVMEFEIMKSFFNEQQCIRRHNGAVAERVGGAAVEVKTFNKEFRKSKSNDELKEMILVANYLNIKEMIANNFTSEEEEAVKKKYEWAFERVDVANDD
ncbi:hypothetical protein WN943_003574 [Citrus x changshan-huyou]